MEKLHRGTNIGLGSMGFLANLHDLTVHCQGEEWWLKCLSKNKTGRAGYEWNLYLFDWRHIPSIPCYWQRGSHAWCGADAQMLHLLPAEIWYFRNVLYREEVVTSRPFHKIVETEDVYVAVEREQRRLKFTVTRRLHVLLRVMHSLWQTPDFF